MNHRQPQKSSVFMCLSFTVERGGEVHILVYIIKWRIKRLEKIPKITLSNYQPIPPHPLPTSLSATSTGFLNTSWDGDSTTSSGL